MRVVEAQAERTRKKVKRQRIRGGFSNTSLSNRAGLGEGVVLIKSIPFYPCKKIRAIFPLVLPEARAG
jgi:hypothetical protein